LKGNGIKQTDYHSLPVATRIRTPNNIISNFTIAHNLLVDRFLIEITQDKKKNRTIELTLGDKVSFC
jgi:hypothetical protein